MGKRKNIENDQTPEPSNIKIIEIEKNLDIDNKSEFSEKPKYNEIFITPIITSVPVKYDTEDDQPPGPSNAKQI